MILVFFLYFFIFILILNICIFIFSYLKIYAENIEISNIPEYHYNYIIKIGIYLFNRYKVIEYSIDKEKVSRSKIFLKFRENLLKKDLLNQLNQIPSFNDIKNLQTNIEYINLNIKLGTESVILTSILIAILSSVIGVFLGKRIINYAKEKYIFKISPIYNNKNFFELNLNCIINTKLVHIIYVIFMYSKKRSEKNNERTSNRRSYDYSYE